ncbi:MAG: FtsK/SpoIIIE domain-containing protein, partial [Bacilli bacterium]
EVNLYLLDFGSEALKIFKDAPQVGDTLSINDSDKIEKMFKMLEEEIELRKEKFSEYTGEYSVYIKNSLDKMPLILVIINNYDNFAESYEIYIERLTTIVREGVKYGIITIVTTTGTSIVRYKFRQNFKQELVLRLNDEMEYATILGKFDKIIPTDCKGRGFVKLDDVYEYQVSYPCNEETMSDMIKELCSNLRQQYKNKAKKIPILPNIVSLTTIVNNISTLKNVPIGIAKETLEIVNYNYNSKDLSIITALDIMITSNFIEQLFNVITMIKDTALIVLDAEDVFEKLNIKAAYYNENFDQVVEKLYCTFKDKKVYQKQFVCAIIGIDNLIGGLNNIAKENFVNLLNMSKDLDQLNFIIIDSVLKLKKLEYEPWYKNNTNNSNGIFVGSGIANQYAIIINKIVREHRDDIPDNFGYCVNNGKAILVKLLEGDKSE